LITRPIIGLEQQQTAAECKYTTRHWLSNRQVRAESRFSVFFRNSSFLSRLMGYSSPEQFVIEIFFEILRSSQKNECADCAFAGRTGTFCDDGTRHALLSILLANQKRPFTAVALPFSADEDTIGGSAAVSWSPLSSSSRLFKGGHGVFVPYVAPAPTLSQGGLCRPNNLQSCRHICILPMGSQTVLRLSVPPTPVPSRCTLVASPPHLPPSARHGLDGRPPPLPRRRLSAAAWWRRCLPRPPSGCAARGGAADRKPRLGLWWTTRAVGSGGVGVAAGTLGGAARGAKGGDHARRRAGPWGTPPPVVGLWGWRPSPPQRPPPHARGERAAPARPPSSSPAAAADGVCGSATAPRCGRCCQRAGSWPRAAGGEGGHG